MPARATARPDPYRLGHTFLFTADLVATTRFYREALGLGQSDGNAYVSFLHGRHGSDHHIVGFGQSHAPGFHHFSFEVENVDQIGVGGQAMKALGHDGWGFGRHVAGSNYFWYVRDPFGGWIEYFCDIDYIPAGTEVPRRDLAPEDSVYLWGPADAGRLHHQSGAGLISRTDCGIHPGSRRPPIGRPQSFHAPRDLRWPFLNAKTSPSRRNMRRSHHALAPNAFIEDKDTGEMRRPHHVDLKTGMYKGRQVLDVKED